MKAVEDVLPEAVISLILISVCSPIDFHVAMYTHHLHSCVCLLVHAYHVCIPLTSL